MSDTIYTTKSTVTFNQIAQRVLGLSSKGPDVAAANPGLTEPVPRGTEVHIPREVPILRGDILLEGVMIYINGVHLENWDRLTINQTFTGVDTFSLGILTKLSGQIKPFGYEKIEIYGDKELYFTGTCLTYNTDTSGSLVQVTGYSLPGVLGDCTPPLSAWPLEFDRQNLNTIAQKLAKPYGIKVICDKPGEPFFVTDCKTGDKVLKYLDQLAGERGMSLRTNAQGHLIIEEVSIGTEQIPLTIGEPPLTKVNVSANGQALFSDIVGVEPMMYGMGGSKSIAKDPRVKTFRSLCYDIPQTLETKTKDEARVRQARTYINALGITASVATWKTPDGKPWEVGQVISLTGFVGNLEFDKHPLVISKVRLTLSSDKAAVAELTLNEPEVYLGKVPKGDLWKFWDKL